MAVEHAPPQERKEIGKKGAYLAALTIGTLGALYGFVNGSLGIELFSAALAAFGGLKLVGVGRRS